MEIFVQSMNHPMYMLSSEGRVYSRKRRRFLTPIKAKRSFIQVSMDGKNVTLHLEIAASFANAAVSRAWFKNEDKKDCRLSNLDWTLVDARPQIKIEPQTFKYEDDQFIPL